MKWRLEFLDGIWLLTTPDDNASFVISHHDLVRLALGLGEVVIYGLDPGIEGVIDCEEFVFVPYCSVCPVGPCRPAKSSMSSVSSNHRVSGQRGIPRKKRRATSRGNSPDKLPSPLGNG
jgi:hypothetical protein